MCKSFTSLSRHMCNKLYLANNNNNNRISIAPYGHNFRGTGNNETLGSRKEDSGLNLTNHCKSWKSQQHQHLHPQTTCAKDSRTHPLFLHYRNIRLSLSVGHKHTLHTYIQDLYATAIYTTASLMHSSLTIINSK